MEFDNDRLGREQTIRDYLLRRLDPEATRKFEERYLSSDEVFEELEASRLLMFGLGQSRVEARNPRNCTSCLKACGSNRIPRC